MSPANGITKMTFSGTDQRFLLLAPSSLEVEEPSDISQLLGTVGCFLKVQNV